MEPTKVRNQQRLDILRKMIQDNPKVSVNRLSKATGSNAEYVRKYAAEIGYQRNADGWEKAACSSPGAELRHDANQ